MIRSIINAIRAIPAFVGRLRNEPILVVGAAMVLLTAYQEAVGAGLGGEDLLIFIGEAALTWLGRQLVYPAVKVDAATAALKDPEPELEAPYTGDPE
jgi:hypothetical protein